MREIQDDNHESIHPIKRRRIEPTPIDELPEDTKPIENPGYYYLSRDEVFEAQIAEAENHQYRVDNGICWQNDYLHSPVLEASAFAHGNLPQDTLKRITWSGSQKATFIELIGRKTASELPSISRIVGKSLVECQTYLDLLRQNTEPSVIDYAEIPAAEEVPEDLIEPDLANVITLGVENKERIPGNPEQDASRRSDHNDGRGEEPGDEEQITNDHDDHDEQGPSEIENLFVLKRLSALSGKQTPNSLTQPLKCILSDRVSRWIRALLRQTMTGPGISVTREAVEYAISQEAEHHALFKNDMHVPSVDCDERQSQNGTKENDSIFTKEEESHILDLIECETEWLEQLDSFNSKIGLQSRGLFADRSNVLSPPDPREPEMEKFMQSR